jgi:GDP-L-fucose synthase
MQDFRNLIHLLFTYFWKKIMEHYSKIYVAGHRGLVGSAIVRQLQVQGYTNIITRTHAEMDLTDAHAVADFFAVEKPEYVFLAAAKVGGIMANNSYPADFLYQNLQIQNNVIHQSYLHGVTKLLFLWSSCIYPKLAEIPIKESSLLTGLLEKTNEPYAIAKITGIKMCQSYNRQYGTNFIACMPTNLYGPYDNFDLTSSHVMPALIRKFHEAKILWSSEVVCRGDGSPMREFLYVDDMADGCIHVMHHFNPTAEQNESGEIFVNIGTGADITIKELAELVGKTVGYTGDIVWDTSKPNGTMRKVMDVSKLEAEWWKAKIGVEEWVQRAYEWFLKNKI